ncbi:MAG: 50S ribosomal protein L4 [Nitrospinae bacterium CG11_big_fil_rev_8_21_14_0_20_56_8]|nr:MAG: 50S ribosomal protein L4 [Nitrospinae bacterium CG11_big_fil_rev_8_21_14_0_20_56_8]
MAQLDLVDRNNQKIGTVETPAGIFDVKVRESLVQQYVTWQMAARRGGNAATVSDKGDLHGSGKKPWRQKGTGRARSGNTRSPVWRGGLTVFGPTPRDYSFKLNKKARKLALKSVLTERMNNNQLTVVDQLNLPNPKTREAVQLLKSLGLPDRTLFLVAEKDRNLELAVRNLPRVNLLSVDGLNVYDLLLHEKIVCTPEALKKIEERLS